MIVDGLLQSEASHFIKHLSAGLAYAFQWIEKKVKKGRIKESPWHSK